ncbi:unnamed protein product [Miscanthus lutarioriparius]|uniref:Transcription factor TFIIIC triple barrel domain-containing protein n=1 Tax=Miscanthus lutarioriparius TaxID=422564 RepID=A0A811M9Z3_9POAL|nr:unnamed protein product [Miscanthus lutarioriparius]
MGILGWFRLGRNGLKSLLGWLNLGSHFSSPSHELVSSVTSRASSLAAVAAAAYAYAKQSTGPFRRGRGPPTTSRAPSRPSSFPSTTASRSTCSNSSTGKELSKGFGIGFMLLLKSTNTVAIWDFFKMSKALEKDKEIGEEEEEEEYVLLELDNCLYSDISPGAPFVLSGLDTLTPTLIVGDSLKMVLYCCRYFVLSCTGCYFEIPNSFIRVSGSNLLTKRASPNANALFNDRSENMKKLLAPAIYSLKVKLNQNLQVNEMAPSEENTDKPASSSKEAPSKEVNHLASVQKILKFQPINAEHSQYRAYQHKDKEL